MRHYYDFQMFNLLVQSTAVGLATACDTLFSQVYGSKSKHRLGIVLLRSKICYIFTYFCECMSTHGDVMLIYVNCMQFTNYTLLE